MSNMILLVFTLSVLLTSPALIVLCAADKTDPSKSFEDTDLESGRSECDVILGSWVGNVQPSFDVSTLTLKVNLAPLYDALQGKECFTYNQLWLELWWVTDNPQNPRPDNFGSVSYFSKYERCHQLEPEHFVFHSTRRLDTQLTDSKRLEVGNSSDLAKFHHIVEHEYILRVCPCGRRIQSGKGNIKICDCEYSSTGKPHCSKLVNLDPGPEALVYPWCRQPAALAVDADNASTKIVVHSPVVNCTSILFTGVMASCTPLQTYDRVQLSLHIVEPDETTTPFFDILSFECNKHQHFGQDDPIVIETNIHSINGSHGDFSVYVGMLQPQSVYCLQIELVDHPYCNSHLMIGHPTGPNPKVCASHVTRPVITPQCAEAHGQIVKRVGNSYYLIAILAVGLAAIIGLGVLCIACACIKMKRRSQTSVKGPHSKDYRHRSLHRPVSTYSSHSLENGSSIGPSEILVEDSREKVFLLRLPNSSCGDDVHFMFFEWMESLGCHVHDLSNPDEDESINADPEGWVQEVLSHPDIKVVVIEGAGHSSVEAKELSARCSMDQSGGPSSTCTATSSLPGSATSSVDGRTSKSHCGSSHHNESTDTDPLLEDPRLELRIFAWKFIQNNFVGKYNQLLIVRFTNDNISTTTTVQDTSVSLTPLRQSFLIPHHLPEVRAWLRPSKVLPKNKGETPRVVMTSQGGARDKMIAACEKRLRSAVLTSQYDCI